MITLEQHLEDHMYVDTYDGWESCECGWREEQERRSESGSIFTHAAHVAATWHEARTVRTVEELDALPIGSVVQEIGEEHTWIRHGSLWHCSCDGTDVPWSSPALFEEQGGEPLLVIWHPEGGAA